jgi:hypothetical protein
MTEKELKPDDMEPVIPDAKDASQYPGNESGTVQSVPEDNESESKYEENQPKHDGAS